MKKNESLINHNIYNTIQYNTKKKKIKLINKKWKIKAIKLC
jgi:hypothetical protein